MPANRLLNQVESLSIYDVVGQDGAVPLCVRHVGLASDDGSDVRKGDDVAVHHMGPPLQRDATISVDVVGTAALTVDNVNDIKTYVDEHLGERGSQERLQKIDPRRSYVIRPHSKPLEGKNGTTVCMRFSCARFILEAYRIAGIILLDTDEESLPPVKRSTLEKIYPELSESWFAEWNTEYEWGLDENEEESWPVVLPAYVFHALNRNVAEIRDGAYKARLGDEVFPR